MNGERLSAAVHHRKLPGDDGPWGPFTADAQAHSEFAITAHGHATTHIYRSLFPRSANIPNWRAERTADADKGAAAVSTLTRPCGYFGVPRDPISADDKSPPSGVPPGTAGVFTSKLKLIEAAGRAVAGPFNGERIAGLAWPAANNELTWLELHY